MDDVAILDRLDRATRFVFESLTRATPGGRIIRRDGLLLVIGADPSPVIVNTILPEADRVTTEATEQAVATYRAVDHLPSLMTRDHRDGDLAAGLAALGWRRLIGLPAMVLETRLPDEPAPPGSTIHRVRNNTDRERWIEGNLHGFAEDESEEAALRSAVQSVDSLRGDRVTAWWAEVDGRGVASAAAWLDPATGMAVVGWVGTDRAYRRRGLGRAVTLAAVNAAFDLGATTVGLQASPMGLPVYQKMGFRAIGAYTLWLPPS